MNNLSVCKKKRQSSSLKSSEQGLKKVRKARRDKGWTIEDDRWLSKASQVMDENWQEEDEYYPYGISSPTWKRFLAGKPIKPESFKAFCEVLGLNWEDVLYQEEIISMTQEEICFEIITQPGSFLRIKSPAKMGKSLLKDLVLERIEQQDNYHIVDFDFQLLNFYEINDLKQFLQIFCQIISHELGLIDKVYDTWKDYLGSNYNTTNYFKNSILKKLDKPLVLVLDHIDLVFEHPHFAEDFCNMLRGWWAKNSENWQKLHLVVVQSTAVYAELDINVSPLENVGVTITLNDFNDAQIQDLLKQYNLSLNKEKIDKLIDLVGRNPYLLNQTFNAMAYHSKSLEDILNQATTAASIYHSHFRECLEVINEKPALKEALIEVITGNKSVKIETFSGFKLQSMGLIELEGDYATPSCRLYHEYFKKQLT